MNCTVSIALMLVAFKCLAGGLDDYWWPLAKPVKVEETKEESERE